MPLGIPDGTTIIDDPTTYPLVLRIPATREGIEVAVLCDLASTTRVPVDYSAYGAQRTSPYGHKVPPRARNAGRHLYRGKPCLA